jgi:hypothetical protein
MSGINPLNPEAGYVSMPEDPREVDAALRAGRVTYRIFPYYSWRYGDRGERFTRSDSAWLARLGRFESTQIRNQVAWLASVLSNRGMPSYLLEVHLRVLSRSLRRADPDRADHHGKLAAAADELRDDRRSRFPEADFLALPDDFAGRLDLGPPRLVRGAGLLVVAAVADERGGIPRAVESLMEWLGDAEVLRESSRLREAIGPEAGAVLDSVALPGRWGAALEELLAEARSRPVPDRP